MPNYRPSEFRVGDRVFDKRDKHRGTCVALRRHTNGSPKWLVKWDDEQLQTWTWEIDLRPLTAERRGA